MPLTALIIDDEPLARQELQYLLDRDGDVTVLAQGSNGIEAVELIRTHRPDVVFLDVRMPGLDGFAVLKKLMALDRKARLPQVVFATAFDQYAVKAFEVNAVDYLLKPVDPVRLGLALQRAQRRVTSDRSLDRTDTSAAISDQLEKIVELVAERQNRRDRLAIKVGERFMLVQAEEIIYASLAEETITVATGQHLGTSNYRTLDELHARLDPHVFWRVHRSHLVNINKIKEIVPWFSRNYILRMKDEKSTEIPVSRTQTRRLREYLKL
jgi:two-component system response regulator LytT